MNGLPYRATLGKLVRHTDNVAHIVGTYEPEQAQYLAYNLNALTCAACFTSAGFAPVREIRAGSPKRPCAHCQEITREIRRRIRTGD